MGIHERAEIIESVSRYETGCNEFPKPLLHLRGKMMGGSNKIIKKAGPLSLQRTTHILRHRTQLSERIRACSSQVSTDWNEQPVPLITREDADGRNARRDDTPSLRLTTSCQFGMR
jgi:hypothetical protein